MNELYETKTTYREIAKDWRDAAIEFSYTWQFWWIYALGCLITGIAVYTTAVDPFYPPGLMFVFAVYAAYQTHKHWGVYNA